MGTRTRHMHTVRAGYLRAFADPSALRRNPHGWRFERNASEGKLISIRDASVFKDIHTLRQGGGARDMMIETDLLGAAVEASFSDVISPLSTGKSLAYWEWRTISRFMAFQLARTPRIFQVHRDEWSRNGIQAGPNDPQLAMVYIAPFYEKWLCGMTWVVCWNTSTLPFLTSDNPVVTWADRGGGAEIGVGFQDPSLQVLFPLTPMP